MILLLRSDARAVPLRDESVDCVVTSPPYWGLRNYGLAGQLGLEATPAEYIENIVAAMREVRRVLRPRGTLWIVLGDSYSTQAGEGKVPGGGGQGNRWTRINQTRNPKSAGGREPMWQPNRRKIDGLKPKDLVGIPWMVAFALRTDGWWLRRDIVWNKPNPMPESIRDRPTSSHEYIFLLAKSRRYHYDANAIREPYQYGDHPRNGIGSAALVQAPGQPAHSGFTALRRGGHKGYGPASHMAVDRVPRPRKSGNKERKVATGGERGRLNTHLGSSVPWIESAEGRNARSVWTIATQPYTGAHFATFPEEMARRCILAGCPPGGTVLDCFAGSGTVGRVAIKLGRRAILSDLGYHDLMRQRTTGVQRSLLTGDSDVLHDVARHREHPGGGEPTLPPPGSPGWR